MSTRKGPLASRAAHLLLASTLAAAALASCSDEPVSGGSGDDLGVVDGGAGADGAQADPGATLSDTASPDAATPDSGAPDPGAADPGVGDPGVGDPGAGDPGGSGDASVTDPGTPDVGGAADVAPLDATQPDAASGLLDPEALPLSGDFTLGVSAHEPTATSIVLWTRYTGDRTLEAVLQRLEDDVPVEELVLPAPEPDDELVVQLDVAELVPGSRYRYWFVEVEEDGTWVKHTVVGRFQTAPAATEMPIVTFAHGSCSKADYQPFLIMDQAATEDSAFFVYNGDTVYADGSYTVDEYHAHYRTNWEDLGHRALRASTGFYSMWDDHEVENNWVPGDIDAQKVENAREAFVRYHAVRPEGGEPGRLWRSVLWGQTLELIVLDSRGERDPVNQRYLSPEQMAWAQERLETSPAVFKFIVNSVPIALFPLFNSDGWADYLDDRDALLGFIADKGIENVYFLSGDIHAAMVYRLEEIGSYDLVASPFGHAKVTLWDFVALLPQVDFITAKEYNYMLVTADPTTEPPEVRVAVKGPEGQVLHEATLTQY